MMMAFSESAGRADPRARRTLRFINTLAFVPGIDFKITFKCIYCLVKQQIGYGTEGYLPLLQRAGEPNTYARVAQQADMGAAQLPVMWCAPPPPALSPTRSPTIAPPAHPQRAQLTVRLCAPHQPDAPRPAPRADRTRCVRAVLMRDRYV